MRTGSKTHSKKDSMHFKKNPKTHFKKDPIHHMRYAHTQSEHKHTRVNHAWENIHAHLLAFILQQTMGQSVCTCDRFSDFVLNRRLNKNSIELQKNSAGQLKRETVRIWRFGSFLKCSLGPNYRRWICFKMILETNIWFWITISQWVILSWAILSCYFEIYFAILKFILTRIILVILWIWVGSFFHVIWSICSCLICLLL